MDLEDELSSDSDFSNDGCSFSFNSETISDQCQDEDTFPYDILSAEDTVNEMVALIEEVNTVVKIPPTTTRILLNHFKWDKEKLYERYYDGDPESLFREAHIVNPEIAVSRAKKQTKTKELCEICFKTMPVKLMMSLACGHQYCTECWTMYITSKVMDEGEVQCITCFDVNCDILVDDHTMLKLLVDPKVRLKYQFLITNNFIMCNRYLKHCPQPGCSKVAKVHYNISQPITCSCSHTFCFQCLENWHAPVTCHLLQKWKVQCLNDSATLKWLGANTKECPSCKVRVEKNGGCNHMQCTNASCGFEYCWICLTNWKTHSEGAKCNRFAENTSLTQEQSRASLEKYLFYYDRYMNHTRSLKFETELLNTIGMRLEKLQYTLTWFDVDVLKKAIRVLCNCRQTLMYTYVFAYYLEKNNESTIFEGNQGDLQNSVELLSSKLEGILTPDTLLIAKPDIVNILRYCDERRKVLLNHVYEGYNKDSWAYTIKHET